MNWVRRIRGAGGMGLTWAAVLFAVGTVPRWLFGVSTDVPIPLVLGAFGFVAGVTFSALLVMAEGRRRFDQMSVRRFAGWGALGGLLLSALWSESVSLPWGQALAIAPAFALACAACASGSLALARRAVRRDVRDTVADAGKADLTHQKRHLLGSDD